MNSYNYILIPLSLLLISTALAKSYSSRSGIYSSSSQDGVSESYYSSSNQPVEIGTVKWLRNHDAALKKSKETGKPVFALFQEVPGCAGCKTFGKLVLSNPLLVEAIEKEFVPLVIYNNQGGEDSKLLAKYKEPSWNYQVVRFLNGEGLDIIPRKDKVWTLPGVAERMEEALVKSNKKVPSYLRSIGDSHIAPGVKEVTVSQHCFWTGERKIGAMNGVLNTEAGFFDGREVTRIWFDEKEISAQKIVTEARKLGVAERVYMTPRDKSSVSGEVRAFSLKNYRKAPESDQKRQLKGTKLDSSKAKDLLNDYQRTKVNAFLRSDSQKALQYLSPAQLSELN